jgi:hypothetical protein
MAGYYVAGESWKGIGAITHPAYASLGDPLFRCAERGLGKALRFPLSTVGEERVVGRSLDRVSNRRLCQSKYPI